MSLGDLRETVKLSIIIVSHNTRAKLATTLESLQASRTPFLFEVIVVDNASGDGSAEMVEERFPSTVVLRNPSNLGFAAANNLGLRAAHGEHLLLLNPDTEVVGDTLAATVRFLDEHPEAAIVGCRLVLPDGSTQESVRSFPSVWNVWCEASFLYKLFPRSRLFGRYHMTYFDYDRAGRVDWVSGAFFLFRRTVLERIGELDGQFFMYAEEMDYCRRAAVAGLATWYTPEGTVRHYWGGMNEWNARVIVWTHGSQALYFQKNHPGMEGLLLQAVKVFGLGLRIPAYALEGLLRRQPRLYAKSKACARVAGQIITGEWRYVPGLTLPPRSWSGYLEGSVR